MLRALPSQSSGVWFRVAAATLMKRMVIRRWPVPSEGRRSARNLGVLAVTKHILEIQRELCADAFAAEPGPEAHGRHAVIRVLARPPHE